MKRWVYIKLQVYMVKYKKKKPITLFKPPKSS